MSKQDIEKRLGFAAQGVKETTRTNAKAKFGNDSISVNKSAKSIISKLKKITPDDREEPSFGLEQFHKRLLARMNEVVKSTDEAIRNPNNANLQWTMQDLKDVIRDETGDSRTLNRWASVWLSSRPGVKAKFELRAQKIMGDGRVYLDLKKAKEWLSSENNKALEQIISSAKANSDKESRGGVDGPKFNYYADLAMMAQEILKSNKREGRMQASRPGVKAKA
jgi:hypothetical protein